MFREKLDVLHDQKVQVLSLEDPNYPAQLKTIPDAPAILCQVGDLTEVDISCVSIVGTREPTAEASNLTLELSTNLTSAGFTVVSGLALGIDTFAHTGALKCSGETIAVLGTDVSTATRQKIGSWLQISKHRGVCYQSIRFRLHPHRGISFSGIASSADSHWQQSWLRRESRVARCIRRGLLKTQGRPMHASGKRIAREGTRTLIKNGAFPFAPDEIDKVVEALQPPEQLEETDTGQLLMNI